MALNQFGVHTLTYPEHAAISGEPTAYLAGQRGHVHAESRPLIDKDSCLSYGKIVAAERP
ncbi:MAG: hypothetical protein IPL99_01885 [Candidatus Competibacteraceae bacterium]|nr:hypothetical protein [Candidatus Competibacteraceae bacterium]